MATKTLLNDGRWRISGVSLGGKIKGLGVYNADGILIEAVRSSPYLVGLYCNSEIERDSHDWYAMESAWEKYR